jgi:hypothetical protein
MSCGLLWVQVVKKNCNSPIIYVALLTGINVSENVVMHLLNFQYETKKVATPVVDSVFAGCSAPINTNGGTIRIHGT